MHRRQSSWTSRRGQERWGGNAYYQPQPARQRSTLYALVGLVLLVTSVLCVSAFLIARLLSPDWSLGSLLGASPSTGDSNGQPTLLPGSWAERQLTLAIEPRQGYINTLVDVSGEGWSPGEPVFLFLQGDQEAEGSGYSYAAALADDAGAFATAFTFPNEARWLGKEWADVVAHGDRSGLEARARFELVPPTPTNTSHPPTSLPTIAVTTAPSATDTPSPTPELVITDWRGEYYANATLSGDPVLVRNDKTVHFDWGQGSPGEGMPPDGFSVRWTRGLVLDEGHYRLTVTPDDGARLWVDDQLFIDEWHDGPPIDYSVDLMMPAGHHVLVLEYFEHTGHSEISLDWTAVEPPTMTPLPSDTPLPTGTPTLPADTPVPTETPTLPADTPVPTETPTPEPVPSETPVPGQGFWLGQYFDNPALLGRPKVVRQDRELNFDWGAGSPAEGIPADQFSVRWTQEITLPAGSYHFFLEMDDGARLWVDGLLWINEWHGPTGQTYSVELPLLAGVHRLRVEYYEDVENAGIRLWGQVVQLPSLNPP